MARIYTETFIRTALTGYVSYAVPVGYVAVVRHVDVVNNSGGNASMTLYAAGIIVTFVGMTSVNQYVGRDVWSVLEAGEGLTVLHSAAGVNTTVSGHLFKADSAGSAGMAVVTEEAVMPWTAQLAKDPGAIQGSALQESAGDRPVT